MNNVNSADRMKNTGEPEGTGDITGEVPQKELPLPAPAQAGSNQKITDGKTGELLKGKHEKSSPAPSPSIPSVPNHTIHTAENHVATNRLEMPGESRGDSDNQTGSGRNLKSSENQGTGNSAGTGSSNNSADTPGSTGNSNGNGLSGGNGKHAAAGNMNGNPSGNGKRENPGSGTGGQSTGISREARGSVNPAYPEDARERGESGTVVVEVEITPSGRAGSIQITSSSGHTALDNAVTATIRNASFEPAMKNGRPVSSKKRFVVNFNLNEYED
jgi:TonB family protein